MNQIRMAAFKAESISLEQKELEKSNFRDNYFNKNQIKNGQN